MPQPVSVSDTMYYSRPSRTFTCTLNIYLVFQALVFSLCVIIFALIYTTTSGGKSSLQSSGPRATDTLKFVIVISRHGNRRSFTLLPNENVTWNCGLGELTLSGHVQAYNLGMKIRSLYNGFLSNEYHSEDILSFSTATDRTLMSGELFLAGLYPPMGSQVWNRKLRWQPIPLYSNSSDMSSLGKRCPRYLDERVVSVRAVDIEYADRVSPITSYLSEQLGFNITDSAHLFDLWDSLFCLDAEGFPLPDWSKPVYPEPMTEIKKHFNIANITGTPTMIRLAVGTLFQDMSSVMARKINGSLSPDRRMYYYSGHDTSIIGLQCLLGIPKESVFGLILPSSAMIFELHENPVGTFYVEVLYLDGGSPSISLLPRVPPECGDPCYFDTLVKITQQYTNISNLQQECQT